jgi:hypothetical protein
VRQYSENGGHQHRNTSTGTIALSTVVVNKVPTPSVSHCTGIQYRYQSYGSFGEYCPTERNRILPKASVNPLRNGKSKNLNANTDSDPKEYR